MKVRDLMQPRVFTVDPLDTWAMATQLMLWAGVRHLPVVEQGRVVGLLSERDAIAARSSGGLSRPVGESLEGAARFVHPDDDAAEVVARMLGDVTDAFPVVEQGRLVGIVTTTDVLARVLGGELGLTVTEAIGGTAADVMTRDPDTAKLDDALLDAVGRMRHRGVRHLPVVDGEHRVIGMLSDRDVRTVIGDLAVSEGDQGLRARIQLARVGDVATRAPLTVKEDAPLTQLARLFADHRIGALPVLDAKGRLVGIVSYVDVLAGAAGPMPPRREQAESTAPAPH